MKSRLEKKNWPWPLAPIATIKNAKATTDKRRVRLEHLWVIPQAMGCGIGRSLFTHAIQVAQELGFQELVIESDPNAAGFYLLMGVVRVGGRVTELEGDRRELPILRYSILP
jgi:GNAT superfamily N-acetyltransferase